MNGSRAGRAEGAAVDRDAGVVELARVERVAAANAHHEPRQPLALRRRQRVPIESFGPPASVMERRRPPPRTASAISGGNGGWPSSAACVTQTIVIVPVAIALVAPRHHDRHSGSSSRASPRCGCRRRTRPRSAADDGSRTPRPRAASRNPAPGGAMLSPASRHSACSASSM